MPGGAMCLHGMWLADFLGRTTHPRQESAMTLPPSSQPSGRDRSVRGSRLMGVARLFDVGLERNALERMLLATATHPTSLGFTRVHLLVWNADRAALDGRLSWIPGMRRSWDDALSKAGQQASDGTDPAATQRLRALRLSIEDLTGALARAWTTRRVEIGEDAHGPWRGAHTVGIVPLMGLHRPYGLLVGEWSASGESRPPAALESYRSLANAALAAHAQFERTRRGAEHAQALASFAHAAVSSLNVAELGNLVVRLAAEST